MFAGVDVKDFRKVIFFYKRALECYSYVQHRKRMQDCHYFRADLPSTGGGSAMMRLRDHHAKRALELQADMNRAVADFEDAAHVDSDE